ncbi:MAG: Fe-S cluster assembly protein SufD, partial [Candidatus Hydrogenedentes bacterium]|nr:Fe-S cluster assembly protein SufD [Candidatus Hydrogenedentota bacterium]
SPEAKFDKAPFLAGTESVRDTGPAWAREVRAKGAARFAELEFPHRKMEDWRFTNIAPIARTPFRVVSGPAAADADALAPFRYDGEWSELVFIDGHFSKDHSRVRAGVTACGFSDAMTAHGALIEKHVGRYLNGTSNAFSALNAAFLSDGAFVHVAKDTAPDAPIHLMFVNTARAANTATHPRNLIVIGPGAAAEIVETHVAIEGAPQYLTNAVTEIAIEENARLHLYKLINDAGDSYHLATTKVRVNRGGDFRSHAICQSGKIIRNEIGVLLDGEGAHCSLHGLYMTCGDQLVDNPTSIEHAKPQCTSWIGYKGVLDDKSHAVFSGKVYVHRVAQKTDSNQLNQNMVLSDKATIDTKPLLEIFADDVKCTHGATVGRPPEELVFYFRTRGMSEAMALGMLTYGFADEVVNQIGIPPVRKRLEQFVFNTYSPIPG